MAAAVFKAAALAFACAACTSIATNSLTFEGTSWRVTAIDGRATPADGGYMIEFSSGRISGRFGCNRWSGVYAVSGEMLTAIQVASTKMACPEPAMAFENQGLAILGQPARLKWTSSRKLTLVNEAGSIALEH
jgi:putative lipoprotein